MEEAQPSEKNDSNKKSKRQGASVKNEREDIRFRVFYE